MKNSIVYISLIVTCMSSCKTKNEKLPDTLIEKKSDTHNSAAVVPKKAPTINIIDTVEIKRNVLCVKDSAATWEIMNEKLAVIFNKKLPDAILLGKIKMTGDPIVWYSTKKTPYFFRAGIPVDKAPTKMIKGMFMSSTGKDSAFVAHFYGPNEFTGLGYEALNEILKENNKRKSTASYEIYKDNRFLEINKKKDPYKIQTDIVMPYKKQ